MTTVTHWGWLKASVYTSTKVFAGLPNRVWRPPEFFWQLSRTNNLKSTPTSCSTLPAVQRFEKREGLNFCPLFFIVCMLFFIPETWSMPWRNDWKHAALALFKRLITSNSSLGQWSNSNRDLLGFVQCSERNNKSSCFKGVNGRKGKRTVNQQSLINSFKQMTTNYSELFSFTSSNCTFWKWRDAVIMDRKREWKVQVVFCWGTSVEEEWKPSKDLSAHERVKAWKKKTFEWWIFSQMWREGKRGSRHRPRWPSEQLWPAKFKTTELLNLSSLLTVWTVKRIPSKVCQSIDYFLD